MEFFFQTRIQRYFPKKKKKESFWYYCQKFHVLSPYLHTLSLHYSINMYFSDLLLDLVWFRISWLHGKVIWNSGALSFNIVIPTNELLSWRISFTFFVFQRIITKVAISFTLPFSRNCQIAYLIYKCFKYNNFTVFKVLNKAMMLK